MPQVSCLLIWIAHAKRNRAALWRQTCPNGLRVSQSLSLGTTSQLLRSKTTCTHAHAGMLWFATLATIARGTSKVPAGKRVCNLARALRTLFLPIHRHSRERTALAWKRDRFGQEPTRCSPNSTRHSARGLSAWPRRISRVGKSLSVEGGSRGPVWVCPCYPSSRACLTDPRARIPDASFAAGTVPKLTV